MDQQVPSNRFSAIPTAVKGVFLTLGLFWAYWPPLAEMWISWSHNPQYSHGFLVPIFSCFLLCQQFPKLKSINKTGSYWGLLIIFTALTLRLAGTYFYYIWLDPISLLPTIAGIAVTFFGWSALRLSWPAIAFLFFMIPLPHNFSLMLAAPLQRVATESSTFFLQVLGSPAVAEGNIILLNEFELGVVEACSGLRMLVVFFAIATAVVMYLKKPLWEKIFLVLTAIPIALVSNIFRITITGILYETVNKDFAEMVFHDLAGWLMMPLALVLFSIEIFFMNRLLQKTAMIKMPVSLKTKNIIVSRIKRNRPAGFQFIKSIEKTPIAESKTV